MIQGQRLGPMGNFSSRNTTASRSTTATAATAVLTSAFGSSEPEWSKNNVKNLIAENKLAPSEVACSGDDAECPICFMNFSALNSTTCCNYEVCTDCYVQLKVSADSLQQKTCSCPFCGKDSLVVKYHPKQTKNTKNNKQNEDLQAPSSSSPSPLSPAAATYLTEEQNRQSRVSIDIPVSSSADRAEIEEKIKAQRRLYPEDRANPQPQSRPSRVLPSSRTSRNNFYSSHNNHNNMRGLPSPHDAYPHSGSGRPSMLPSRSHPSVLQSRSHPVQMVGGGGDRPMLQRLHNSHSENTHSSSVYRASNGSGMSNTINSSIIGSSSGAARARRTGGGSTSRLRDGGIGSDHFGPDVLHNMVENTNESGVFQLTNLQQLEDMMLMEAIRQSMLDAQPTQPAPAPPTPGSPLSIAIATPHSPSPRVSPPRAPNRMTPPRTPVRISSPGSYEAGGSSSFISVPSPLPSPSPATPLSTASTSFAASPGVSSNSSSEPTTGNQSTAGQQR